MVLANSDFALEAGTELPECETVKVISNLVPSTLTPMDVAGRLPRLRERFAEAGVDALLVTSLTNIRYLTGFSGTAGMLLVGPDNATLLTDGRYRTQSEEQLAEAEVEADIGIGRPAEQKKLFVELCAEHARVGLEAEDVTWATQVSLAKALAGEQGNPEEGSADPTTVAIESIATESVEHELVATVGLVGALRRVKDAGELARMAKAAEIADAALAAVLHLLVPGVTEVELAATLDHRMRQLGASDRSFETIVASGPHSAMPHARPTQRQIEEGELVVIDFGAIFDGYCSDMTRTFCIGEPRSKVLAALVEVVAAAQAAGVASVSAGVDAADVDRVCREVISSAGWDEAFMHGTGHGVGLDIHEAPSVGSRSTDKLEASCVVTVEPGVYLPGHGGARIEDTVVVTADGCTVLTLAPKDLVP